MWKLLKTVELRGIGPPGHEGVGGNTLCTMDGHTRLYAAWRKGIRRAMVFRASDQDMAAGIADFAAEARKRGIFHIRDMALLSHEVLVEHLLGEPGVAVAVDAFDLHGQISSVLTVFADAPIIEMIYALDKLAPGAANYDTLLYGAEGKFYGWAVVTTAPRSDTTRKAQGTPSARKAPCWWSTSWGNRGSPPSSRWTRTSAPRWTASSTPPPIW